MEQKPIKPYKQLKQKQKAKISDYMYLETQAFWQAIKIWDLQSTSRIIRKIQKRDVRRPEI